MKILFSPSETKSSGGNDGFLEQNRFIFPTLYNKRLELIEKYNNFIKNATKEELEKLFGTSKEDVLEKYKQDIFKSQTKKAIQRYEGVAYDYLDYENLAKEEQNYVDENLLIFSNLFGILKASDRIPEYKLKQGQTFDNIKIEKYYLDNFSDIIDEYLENEDILDLRAGFYEKFYKIKGPYLTMKFIRNGKVVSHFAKAYRGEIVKILAQKNIHTIEEIYNLNIENLKVEEILKQKNKTEIIYNIL